MEAWLVIIVTACIAALLRTILSSPSLSKTRPNYPPGPGGLRIINSFLWLKRMSSGEAEGALRALVTKFGPIFTIQGLRRPLIFISSRSLAHEALVQKGAVFADRPKGLPTSNIITANQHSISSAGYGPTWRVLRRNLTSQMLNQPRVKEYSRARKWVLDVLLARLRETNGSDSSMMNGDKIVAVKPIDHFRFAMFCLLVLMCFGDKLDETKIKEIEAVEHRLLIAFNRFQILNYLPWLTKVMLRKRWNELFEIKRRQKEALVPLIRARKALSDNQIEVTSYVDTLLTLEIQDSEDEAKRKLTEDELVSASSEFLNAGTDTTSTALQWIMANLVKYPHIQIQLLEEIKGVVTPDCEEVKEEDLSKMPYLKAVVLEGLRRHPPGHFVLPHTVTQEVELGGFTIPNNAVINFMVADMGWDPKVWEDPMMFKPERFLSSDVNCREFDITGSRDIKMMPFGAGRRICPGLGLAMLHLEYFVANLVWNFEWAAVDEVDLTEKQEFTTVMKHPLRARISPRQTA